MKTTNPNPRPQGKKGVSMSDEKNPETRDDEVEGHRAMFGPEGRKAGRSGDTEEPEDEGEGRAAF
jgi:hypothetical protein